MQCVGGKLDIAIRVATLCNFAKYVSLVILRSTIIRGRDSFL